MLSYLSLDDNHDILGLLVKLCEGLLREAVFV